jgi:2'-hydroxyisoflavone reductase
MRLLVIGGTRFVGRHLVDDALRRGWDVTLFHRGLHPSPVSGAMREIFGDRETDLARLDDRWDAVVDMCGNLPRLVAASADALRHRVHRYAYVSSESVYAGVPAGPIDERSPVRTLDAPTETIDGDTFGALKALCEDAVRERYGDAALIVRPGLIVGPFDPTDRFGYWVRRFARGGEVLAPGDGTLEVGFVDARDLTRWLNDALEARVGGTFNVSGPQPPMTMAALFATLAEVAGTPSRTIWSDERFLLDAGVQPWSDLPLWTGDDDLLGRIDVRAAIATGLRFSPVRTTVEDVLAWERTHEVQPKALSAAREAEVLRRWRAQRAAPLGG